LAGEEKGDVYDFMLFFNPYIEIFVQEIKTFGEKHKIIDVPLFRLNELVGGRATSENVPRQSLGTSKRSQAEPGNEHRSELALNLTAMPYTLRFLFESNIRLYKYNIEMILKKKCIHNKSDITLRVFNYSNQTYVS
jgi:hypothetical protein